MARGSRQQLNLRKNWIALELLNRYIVESKDFDTPRYIKLRAEDQLYAREFVCITRYPSDDELARNSHITRDRKSHSPIADRAAEGIPTYFCIDNLMLHAEFIPHPGGELVKSTGPPIA